MSNEKREWINTITSIAVLIVLIIGIFQLVSISVNLKEITSEKIRTSQIEILNDSGDVVTCIYRNESGYLIIDNSGDGCP